MKEVIKQDCRVCVPNKTCYYPCRYGPRSKRADERYGYLRLWYRENIKSFKSSYQIDLRSFFTLISDIGGCIGIFLGWSILQIIEYIYERFVCHHLGIGKISNVIQNPDNVMEISTETSDGWNIKTDSTERLSEANFALSKPTHAENPKKVVG